MTVLTEKLRRLAKMSLSEIRFRTAQKLRIAREQWQLALDGSCLSTASWWSYWAADEIFDASLRAGLQGENGPKATRLLTGYFAERKMPRFFWDLALREKLPAAYEEFFPRRVESLRAEAEAICEHRFRIFTYPEVSCGAEVPWRHDLVSGTESGLEHHARIPYLDFTRVGDSKVVWEPNRHQHFILLAQAYLLTSEERYAEEALTQWEHWQRENPYLRGINWASSLEVAFRSWSWLWMMYSLLGSRALTGARIAELTAALARNAEFIAANLSIYFSPNTHLLGEGFALFVIGMLLPELRGSERWRERGRAILTQQLEKQVRADGSHFEQSTYYHRYAIEFFLCAALLAERNECPFPPPYQERLERMVEFLQSASLPAGRDPMIGDSDGGRLIAFGPHDPNDWGPVLSIAAVYFRRGDFRHAAKGLHEQTLWVLGPDAPSRLASIEPVPPREASRTFLDAGLVTMRSGQNNSERLLLFDAGPQGMGASAHGHADALAFVCSAGGINWLVDPGTYVYTASRPWRDFFRSTRAHNTVAVDGQDQAKRTDFFKWRALPEVRLERSVSTALLDYAVGVHTGYLRLSQPVQHRRRIIFVKPDYWIISDELAGEGTHLLEFFFHFAPGAVLEDNGNGWLASKGGKRFLLLTVNAGVTFRVATGEESPIQGWYSQGYGHREPALVLVASVNTTLPARFFWLLMPEPAGPTRVHRCGSAELSLAVETSAWLDFIAASGTNVEIEETKISTDAELAFVRQLASGDLVRLVVINGSTMDFRGQKFLRARQRLEELSLAGSNGELSVQVRPAVAFRVRLPSANVAPRDEKEVAAKPDDWIEFRGAN